MITIIILNEKAYAEECLQKKFISDKPFYTLSILAKYYYHCLGYRKSKITELLIDFIKNYYPKYDCNKAMWNESIEKIAKNVEKYTLFEIDGVWITESELETIANIHNQVLEKLAFTLLCLAKLGNIKNPKNNGWVNNDDKEIFNLARVSCTAAKRDEKISDLYEMSLLELPKRIDNLSVRVTYVNDNSKKRLFVSDFRELGYEYLKYIGNINYARCGECGRLFKISAHNKTYCSMCSKPSNDDFKYITCIDCGKVFKTKNKNNTSCRCSECQNIRNKKKRKIWYETNKR